MTKEQTLYVMQYEDGQWVQRDDSSGPMSTGGYPFPVKELRKATQWTDKAEALKYRHTCRNYGPWTLHILVLKTIPEIITPADEAEARQDKEFLEFQRLAKKYGITGTGECPFSEAWVGKCKKVPEVGEIYCPKHQKEKCFKCGRQATRNCGHTSFQFVCGYPMCDSHMHHPDG